MAVTCWVTWQVLVFMQDDIIPPNGCDWIDDLITVYDSWPRMGVVGLQVMTRS